MSESTLVDFNICVASHEDAEQISALMHEPVGSGVVLPRPLADIQRHINTFLVAKTDKQVVGCVALKDYTDALVEVRSLVVKPSMRGCGCGTSLINAAVKKVMETGRATRIFALTGRPALFERAGFHRVCKELFPEKVWNDCSICPKLNCCDEIAVMLEPHPKQ
jgi:amino-acid N-acetyltransferase